MPTSPIVGAFFRPPAVHILNYLPSHTPLILSPEPSNPYDPNAIAVRIATANLPSDDEEFLEGLAPYGTSLEELEEFPTFHLGYIPRSHTSIIAGYLSGTFFIAATGKPSILCAVDGDESNG